MGFFDEFDSAPVGFGRNYLGEGDYTLEVREIKEIKPDESKQGKHSFVASMRVLAASGATATPVGGEASWVQSIPLRVTAADPKAKERALGTIKQFLTACLGSAEAFEGDDAPKASDVYQMATSAAQPFTGATIRARVRTKVTKNGNDFSVHTFYPVG